MRRSPQGSSDNYKSGTRSPAVIRQRGTSIAELLVALAIGSVVSLAAVQLHSNSIRAAVTIDQFELLADKARILQRILHSEIAGAGMAPCGATTPVHDWTGGEQERAACSLPANGGLEMNNGTLSVSRFEPSPEYADLSYQQIISGELGVALQLSGSPSTLPEINEYLLIGDCTLLHRVRSNGGSGSFLSISGQDLDPTQLPESGWIWRVSAISGIPGTTSEVIDPRLHQTAIGRRVSPGGADGVAVLTIDDDPALRGLTELYFSFSSCENPSQFMHANDINDWQSVCAVRASTILSASGPSTADQLDWPLTITIPVQGRL
ncbi:PilW family protein [Halorhodospira halochloris]|uniref:PilW family protein n=1 Tax=Halorhodospira halochloris TaxID=1052 RepID=UPI000BBAB2A4|nr:hypothetical protein [Halorhodospira halochloris]